MSEADREPVEDPRDRYDVDVTIREIARDGAMSLLRKRAPLGFRLSQVREEAGLWKKHDRSIQRALAALEAQGYLERDDDKPKYWRPGPRAPVEAEERGVDD